MEHPPEVAPDGSPVAVYKALPEGRAPALVAEVTRPGGSVLELGCGAGRVTRGLVARGHPVVAVDESADMLRHVDGPGIEPVQADVFHLDLGRRFDCVLAASHLIDSPDADQRAALLAVARRHVAEDRNEDGNGNGVVILERYEPTWARAPESGWGTVGDVEIEVEIHEQRGDAFDATVTYRLADLTWSQSFTAAAVDDDLLISEAATAGLQFDRWLDDRLTWALLHPS